MIKFCVCNGEEGIENKGKKNDKLVVVQRWFEDDINCLFNFIGTQKQFIYLMLGRTIHIY